MRRFVFSASGRRTRDEAWRFALVNAVAAAQVWAVSLLLARWLLPALGWSWQAETLAHMAGVGSTVLTSYAMHKAFTFRRKGDA
jgi:putative flippase GtrA